MFGAFHSGRVKIAVCGKQLCLSQGIGKVLGIASYLCWDAFACLNSSEGESAV